MSSKIPPSTPPLKQRLKKVMMSSEKRNEAVRWRAEVMGTKFKTFFRRLFLRTDRWRKRRSSSKSTISKLQKMLKEREQTSLAKFNNMQDKLELHNQGLHDRLTSQQERNSDLQERLTILQTSLKNTHGAPNTQGNSDTHGNLGNKQALTRLQGQHKEQEKASSAKYKKMHEQLKSQAQTLQDRLKIVTADYNKQRIAASEAKKELNAVTHLVKGDAFERLKVTDRILKTKSASLVKIERRVSNVLSYIDQLKANETAELSVDSFVTKALASGYHEQGRYFLIDELLQHDWEALLTFFTSADNGFDALEKLRPLFAPWIKNYHALIDVIEDRGFQIRPIDDYIDNGMQDKTVYIYHDVHAWDIIPALGMVLANKDRGICTTFCLNIDQAHVDIAHEAGYRIFGTLYGDNAKLGLHCNPFASWVRMDVFNKDEKAFTDWFNSDTSTEELKAMVANDSQKSGIFKNYTRETAEAGTYARLDKNFQKLKSFYPEARVANHHGDIINQLCKATRGDKKNIHSFLFVATMLREEKVKRLGVLTSPTAIRRQAQPAGTIYGEFENREKYFENLHAELADGVSRQLINHPGAISNSGLVMNLDFVRELGTGSFEQYPPMRAKTTTRKPTQKAPLSATIVQLEDDD